MLYIYAITPQIGCPNEPEDFVVSGTCSEQLYGMCEALWEPNLSPDELFETISQVKYFNINFTFLFKLPFYYSHIDYVLKIITAIYMGMEPRVKGSIK